MAVPNSKKHQRNQRKVAPVALRAFVNAYSSRVASRALGYSSVAINRMLQLQSANEAVEAQAAHLLERYREFKELGRVPDLSPREVASPDGLMKAAIMDFPDTDLGQAFREAYERAGGVLPRSSEDVLAAVAKTTTQEQPQPQQAQEEPVQDPQPDPAMLRTERLREWTRNNPDVVKANMARAREKLAQMREEKRAAKERADIERAQREREEHARREREEMARLALEHVEQQPAPAPSLELRTAAEILAEPTPVAAPQPAKATSRAVRPARSGRLLHLATRILDRGVTTMDRELITQGRELLDIALEMMAETE